MDDAPKGLEAGETFRRASVDLVFCYVGTYATSSTVLPVIQHAKAPVVVLNLQPIAALDYAHTDTGEWLANCSGLLRSGNFRSLYALGEFPSAKSPECSTPNRT